MATKNTKSIVNYFTMENAIDSVSFINFLALNTTEKSVLKGIALAEKTQEVLHKNIKKGLTFSAKKQDVIFNTLEMSKEKLSSYLNKK